MRIKLFPWLGQHFVNLSWEGSGDGTIADETRDLFARFAERLDRYDLDIGNIVRTRLWTRDFECWQAATAERNRILTGKARSATSSHVRPDRLGAKARVACDLLAMAAPPDGGARVQREYAPKTNVLRSLTWGGIVFMSGVTDMTHVTLDQQVPVILERLSATLANAGATWDDVVRVSFMLHHEEPIETMRRLFDAHVSATIPCVDFRFVDTRQGKRAEIELTAKPGR